MEAVVFSLAVLCSQPVITEVCSNPFNETAGEFVEIHNNTSNPLNTTGYTITDGDALDDILPWAGSFPQSGVTTGTAIIPPGGFAVLLEEDYPNDPWLTFTPGTVILTTGDHSICNGLAASSDPLTLYSASGTSQADVVSTYGTPVQSDVWSDCDDDGLDSIPFDPGEGLTVNRYPLNSSDTEGNWFTSNPTPGQGPEAPPDTFFITIDSLYLDNTNPNPGTTAFFTAIVSCWGTASPDSGEVVLFIDANGDSLPQWEERLYSYPAPNLIPGQTDTLETSFTAPAAGWYPAVCSAPSTTSRLHFSTGSGVNPVITEVMANPENEDQEEYIEVFFPGAGVFPLAGCSFTDGDAVDQIEEFNGIAYIQSGQTALIIDPEYQGTLNIPAGTPFFSPANTTLGNGLSTTDPILLYGNGDPSLENLFSTAGTPLLFDDPLMCDDDGLDNIPFDPGNGHSIEKIIPTGPDAEFNWMASPEGGTPGTLPSNQEWIDLCTDTVYTENSVAVALFSNCGILDAYGTCTIFSDTNGDLTPSAGEIFSEQSIFLCAGQTDTMYTPFTLPDSGLFVIAATIMNPQDTIPDNNSGYCGFVPAKPAWPVITEVLCNPANEDCDEFVELFFPGPGQADMTEFSVTDNDAIDNLVSEETPFLTAACYALVLDPEYAEGSEPYDIPPETMILHPANTTIGDGLSGTDPVLLLLDSLTVSTYGTPWNNEDAIPFDPGENLSVERIAFCLPDSENSWFSSPLGPTPGRCPEGITSGVDYGVASLTLSPPMGAKNTETTVTARVTSFGTDSVAQGSLHILIKEADTEIYSFSPSPPEIGDTLSINTTWNSVSEERDITAEIVCAEDVNPENNILVNTWNHSPTVCINEIFYQETEWVELFNGTGNTVSLSAFTLSDPSTDCELPDKELPPGGFVVLVSNEDDFFARWGAVSCPVIETENWPTLNNNGDTLTLKTGDQAADMVPYTSSWGGSASSSLERRSPSAMGFMAENWGTSISGATPGKVNSIGEVSSKDFLTLSPTVFNPPDTPLRIEINLPMQACNLTVKVYDVRGMQLEKLYSAIVPGETIVLEWNDYGYPVGRYIIFAEARCSGEVSSDAKVVILAHPL